MSETQLFWTFVVSVVGPLIAAAVLWWGKGEAWFNAGRKLLAITLAVGVFLSASIAFGDGAPLVVSTVAGKAQPLFYGMPFALDRFAAIFFAGIGAAGVAGLWNQERKQAAIGAVCVVLSQLVVVSGSVMGFMFFWLPLMWLAVTLCGKEDRSHGHASSMIAAGAMVLAGWFFLTGGALFNDLQTIGYAAAGVGPSVLRVAYILLSLGFLWAGTIGAYPVMLFRKAHLSLSGATRTVLASVLGGAALYGYLRMTLFVMPVSYKGTAAVIAAIALLGAIWMFRKAQNAAGVHDAYAHLAAGQGAMVFAGLSFALVAVSKEAWSLMNLVLFSAMLLYIGNAFTLLGTGRLVDWMKEKIDRDSVNGLGGLAAYAPWLSLSALALTFALSVAPASLGFVGIWMQVHGMVEEISSYGWAFGFAVAMYLIAYVVAASLATAAAFRVFARVFLGEAPAHVASVKEGTMTDAWQVHVGALGAVCLGVAAPAVLVALGADPIISNGGQLSAGIDTLSGSFVPMMMFLLLAAFTAGAMFVRKQVALLDAAADTKESELPPSVFAAAGRRICIATKPICEKVTSRLPKIFRV